jgi:hypothetical protein
MGMNNIDRFSIDISLLNQDSDKVHSPLLTSSIGGLGGPHISREVER